MKEIISSYRMDVYSDGSIEFVNLSEANKLADSAENTITLASPDGKPSAKIEQILMVLKELQTSADRIIKLYELGMRPIRGELTSAIKTVSSVLRIASPSVIDKFARQNNVSLAYWEPLIEQMIVHNNPDEIKSFLKKNVVQRYQEADLKAIDEFFAETTE